MNTVRTRFFKKGPVVILMMIFFIPIVICTSCLILWVPGLFVRPMFHEWVGIDDGARLWAPIPPVSDRKGNFGYLDEALNLLVIVVTDDPEHYEYLTPTSNSPRRARLMPGTRYEVAVEDKKDTLLICHAEEYLEFALGPGEAKRLWKEMISDNQGQHIGLIQSIASHYQGSDKTRIEDFAEKRKAAELEKGAKR